MATTKTKNQLRKERGELQVGRRIGTTRSKKPIQKKEFERLINALNRSTEVKSTTKMKLHRAFTLLYLTGCRISEIVHFTSQDIEKMIEHNEFSLFNNTKTKRARLITLDANRQQIEFLKKILPKNDGYLFPRNGSTNPMSVDGLKMLMNKFIHEILGELYSSHSFRVGYITTAHSHGLSLEHIRQDIGHANISTTARYAQVTNEEISRGKNLREW